MADFNWVLCDTSQAEADAFSTPDRVLALAGECINANPMSNLRKVSVAGNHYYVKCYERAGKGLRRYFGRSRVRAEWENLMFFHSIGLPTARVVAYGEQNGLTLNRKGILVIQEIRETADLASRVDDTQAHLGDREWVDRVVRRLAMYIRTMHEHHFVHNDLKWRNILVERSFDPEVYIIDCPLGRRVYGPLFRRGVIKDLACLDKVAKYQLPKTMRLRFYKLYRGINQLGDSDRRQLSRILAFFQGRE
ncbi:MAG: lipopolysaccharide kinase InaA family protein [Pseudomonadales bacterium]